MKNNHKIIERIDNDEFDIFLRLGLNDEEYNVLSNYLILKIYDEWKNSKSLEFEKKVMLKLGFREEE